MSEKRKTNRYGNKIFSIKELSDLMPKLEGLERNKAIKIADKMGMRHAHMDVLRILLGFTKKIAGKYSKEYDKAVIDLYIDHPNESAYTLYRKYGKELKIADYQSFYKIIRRNGLETNRKRDFWTPIKDKKLLFERNTNHRTWREISMMFGKSTGAVQSHFYTITGTRRPRIKK